ncbi:stemmadenine O-acetyltransferase-like [Mercurialis annua]|uniref:stemmadenine O-acetyltransferase-like n=1 Tax=Mercurialis annua TaxID=3986 RepID=UPI00215EFD5C|nr:stemmadenine O-acetyltransferase-like [Mercurialis annua]
MKMKLEVEFISQELIKPFSPTPDHLRQLRLSFLDQLQPPVCMPIVLFYSKKSGSENYERCNELKKSLSKALAMFYPLAGRINNDTFIDCNDEGALFVEAKANCQLSDILQDYNPSDSNKLIPLPPHQCENLTAFFQVTLFKCGGLCISFSLLHKLGDALSQFQFLNSWAAITRGDYSEIATSPIFGMATLFPPIKMQSRMDFEELGEDKIVTKRFVFDASTIAALQAKYSNEIGYSPSRVVALAGFIWSRFIAAIQTNKTDRNHLYALSNVVNFRRRIEPPLSNMHFGNLFTTAWVKVNINNRQQKSADAKYNYDANIVSQMSDAMRSVTPDAIFKLTQEVVKGEVIGFFFTSLCKMPIYEADFGWGKPVFVSSANLPLKNLVSFLDAKQGGAIEAWINLNEENMAKFEIDKEFLAHLNSSTQFNAKSRL